MSIGIILTLIFPCCSVFTVKGSWELCDRKILIRSTFIYSKIWCILGYCIYCEFALHAPRTNLSNLWLIYINSCICLYIIYKSYWAWFINWRWYLSYSRIRAGHFNWGGCYYWSHLVTWWRCRVRWIYLWRCTDISIIWCFIRIKVPTKIPSIINCGRSEDYWL